ncbi:SMP-30/gluconolactonase/LRE family protein [Kribbella sp. C-35]|uniref:SMP-30/gluconolactonase/LRE family protein n=1 Tax=Kribbella sp. C-35 TaxID=2789276 RepID=UPI003979CE2F
MSYLRKLALIVSAVALTVAAAAPFPASIPLPVDFQPEGIATGPESTFYAGSLRSGDIYRGSLRTGEGAIFVDAPPGRIAAGMKVERAAQRLWVAGGPTGHGYVYSTRDGSTVADLVLSSVAGTLINDVVVTHDAAYFTDTFSPVFYKVPIGPGGRIGAPQTIPYSGPAAVIGDFPNWNGIDATRDGKHLIVGHSSRATMYLVDPESGASRAIAITGGAITPGTPDGILLDGRNLWVVENFANRLVKIELSADLTSGEIVAAVTNSLFRVPTTVAEDGNRLALVNGRFDLGFPPPFGPGAPPGTDFDVVQLDKP